MMEFGLFGNNEDIYNILMEVFGVSYVKNLSNELEGKSPEEVEKFLTELVKKEGGELVISTNYTYKNLSTGKFYTSNSECVIEDKEGKLKKNEEELSEILLNPFATGDDYRRAAKLKESIDSLKSNFDYGS